MEPPDNQRRQSFPEGYTHLDEMVTEAEARLQQLNFELNQRRQHPALDYNMGDELMHRNQQPQRSLVQIQEEKDNLKAEVYKEIESATARASPQLGKEMQDIAFNRLYQEEINQLEAEGNLPDPAADWTFDKAQVSSMNTARQRREELRREDGNRRPVARTLDEMTDRFLEQLDLGQPYEEATERNIQDPETER